MKNFLKNWNVRRIVYLVGGLWMISQSFFDKTWWIAIFGLYFLSMAIFQFGCASGNCSRRSEKI
jgi:hypothetical protein